MQIKFAMRWSQEEMVLLDQEAIQLDIKLKIKKICSLQIKSFRLVSNLFQTSCLYTKR